MAVAAPAEGRVVQIIGTVLDIEFPPDHLPALNNAVDVILDDGTHLVTEVQQHLGNNWVRCLAMDSTDGLRRDTRAIDMGQAISVPVGEQSRPQRLALVHDLAPAARWHCVTTPLSQNRGRCRSGMYPRATSPVGLDPVDSATCSARPAVVAPESSWSRSRRASWPPDSPGSSR